jgi:hypothetical protein
VLGVPLTWNALHGCQKLIKRQVFEERFSFLRVIAIARRELIQKAYGIDDPHLFKKQVDRLLSDFAQWLCLDIHRVTSAISSSGETTLVGEVSSALARLNKRSSHVQK